MMQISDSSHGSEHSKLKTFWKVFNILEAIKNTHDSEEDVKIETLTQVGKKLIPTLTYDFEGFRIQCRKQLYMFWEQKRTKLEVKLEDVTKLLQSHDKTLKRQGIASFFFFL